MNYKNIHDSIINRAKERELSGYLEKHHIIPKCLGGNNDKSNLVKLTPKEHYLIHKILIRIYPEEYKLAYALFQMCLKSKNTSERMTCSAKQYEEAKLLMSKATKERLKQNNPWKGKKHSKESIEKQKISAKNRVIENEEERRDKISNTLKGKKKSKDHIKNISESKKGSKNPMFGKKWKLIDGKRFYY